MKYFLTLLLVMTALAACPQSGLKLTDQSMVSLITCGPGEELYEAFGHTAIRISDPPNRFDLVYNYGTFDFNQPDFYWNFIQGRSLYMLDADKYRNFIYSYRYYGRSVTEQFLNMTMDEKQTLLDTLLWNARPENRSYLYDYFFDNCSTRPRDVISAAMGGKVVFDTAFLGDDRLSIRQLTDIYIKKQQPWGDLGIDLCLGQPIDRPATAREYMFLPEELEKAFDHAEVERNGQKVPLVTEKQFPVKASEVAKDEDWATPQMVFVIFLLFSAVAITIQHVRKRSARIYEGLIFIVTSIIGWNGMFLWFMTDHYTAHGNWNILWALPTNLLFGLAIMKKDRPGWTRHYALALIVLYAAMLLGWNHFPQLLHYSLRFVVVLLLFIAVGVFRISRTERPH